MNLENLSVQEINEKEASSINGGDGWWEMFGVLVDAMQAWANYCEETGCAGNYDNNEDVGGMGFPTCA